MYKKVNVCIMHILSPYWWKFYSRYFSVNDIFLCINWFCFFQFQLQFQLFHFSVNVTVTVNLIIFFSYFVFSVTVTVNLNNTATSQCSLLESILSSFGVITGRASTTYWRAKLIVLRRNLRRMHYERHFCTVWHWNAVIECYNPLRLLLATFVYILLHNLLVVRQPDFVSGVIWSYEY